MIEGIYQKRVHTFFNVPIEVLCRVEVRFCVLCFLACVCRCLLHFIQPPLFAIAMFNLRFLDFFQCVIESWNEHECNILTNEDEPSFLQEHEACVLVTILEGMGAITIQQAKKGIESQKK
jgi:hypothetical protein